MVAKGIVKHAPVAFKCGARVDVTGCAKARGNVVQRNVFGAQLAILVAKIVHGAVRSVLFRFGFFGWLFRL